MMEWEDSRWGIAAYCRAVPACHCVGYDTAVFELYDI